MDGIGRALVADPVLPAIPGGDLLSRLDSTAQRAARLEPMLAGETLLAVAFAEADNPLDTAGTHS